MKIKCRVKEAQMEDGSIKYFPQVKGLFRWKSFYKYWPFDDDVVYFNTWDEAADELIKYRKELAAQTPAKVKYINL